VLVSLKNQKGEMGMKKLAIKSGYEKRWPISLTVTLLLITFFFSIFLASCARVSLYSVDIKYEPVDTVQVSNEKVRELVFTVSKFNDLRQVDDKTTIGKVKDPNGTQILILPKFRRPSDAVTHAFQDYLSKAGYELSTETPGWNLQDDTIKKEWGNIVIGGNIHEFKVDCVKKWPVRKYTANVKLTVVFANVRTSKTRFKVNVESSPTFEDLRFSEKKIEEVINDALSAAIRKTFDNQETKQKIINMAEGTD
jgi:hypothetical protein